MKGYLREIIITLTITCLLFPLHASGAGQDDSTLFGKLIKLSSTELMQKGKDYGFKRHMPDSALVCFSIVANRYDKRMSREDKQQCIDAYNMMYYAYNLSSFDYQRSFECLTKAARIANENDIRDPQLYANFGVMYQGASEQTGGHDLDSLAYNNLAKAFDLSIEKKNTSTLDIAFSNLIQVAMSLGRWSDMAHYNDLYRRQNRKETFYSYNLLMYQGLDAMNRDDANAAINCFEKQLAIANDVRSNSRIRFVAYYNLAPLYLDAGRQADALHCYSQMNAISQKYQLKDLMPVVFDAYATYYDKIGDKDRSTSYRSQYLEAKDSLLNYRISSNVTNMQFLGELNDLHEKMNDIQYRNRMERLLLCVAVIIICLFAVFLVILNHKNRKLRRRNESLYQRSIESLSQEQRERRHREIYEKELQALRQQEPQQEQAKYQNSHLGNEAKDTLLTDILNFMDNSQDIYAVDFSLERLAQGIGSKPKYVSQIINEHFGYNFNVFLNEYRIKEACRRLNDRDSYGNYTIAAISESVGFKSRSYFATVFRKVVGLKPSEYLQQACREPVF